VGEALYSRQCLGNSMEWVKNPTLLPLWDRLRVIAREHEGALDLLRDDPGYYKLVRKRSGSQFDPFLAICIQRQHVSLYLTPLYRHPHLTSGMPAVIRTHKTGKCTLRFSAEDDAAIEHVGALLQNSLMAWVEAGMIR
jgi:hypothetical protein